MWGPALGFLVYRGGMEPTDLILERYYLSASQSFGEKAKMMLFGCIGNQYKYPHQWN
jgi:hypothetical protein